MLKNIRELFVRSHSRWIQ